MEKKQKRGGWHQLKQGDGAGWSVLLDAEMFQKDRAKVLKVDPGTISRERKRKRKNGRYDAANAGIKATMARGHSKHQGMKVNADAAMKATHRGARKEAFPRRDRGKDEAHEDALLCLEERHLRMAVLGAWPAVRPFALHQALRQEKAEEKDRAAHDSEPKKHRLQALGGRTGRDTDITRGTRHPQRRKITRPSPWRSSARRGSCSPRGSLACPAGDDGGNKCV